jgi:hypothetical protein
MLAGNVRKVIISWRIIYKPRFIKQYHFKPVVMSYPFPVNNFRLSYQGTVPIQTAALW